MRAINVSSFQNRLDTGSKKRLSDFSRNLATDREGQIFDDKALKLLEKYVWDQAELENVRRYLNEVGFTQSRKEFQQLEDAVCLYAQPNHTSFRWNENYQKSLKELRQVFQLARLQPVEYKSDDDCFNNLPKVDTHSGWSYIETGIKEKGGYKEGSCKRLCMAEEAAKLEANFGIPLLPAYRTQGSGAFEETSGSCTGESQHKTRLVSMVDINQVLSESRYSVPFQGWFGGKFCYAGGKQPREIAGIINTMRSRHSNWVSLDYSKFDASLSDWLIADAFELIKSAFVRVDEKLWTAIVNSFIHKAFVMPSGLVYSDKGVPSGSMFTQIIDSICNMIMIQTYLNATHNRGEMIVMGDDNLLYTYRPIRVKDMASYLAKNFGTRIHTDGKLNQGRSSEDPVFLSRTWKSSGQWRHPSVLISKLLYPERFRKYDQSGLATPALLLYGYVLEYNLGMGELMDVERFLHDNKFQGHSFKQVAEVVDMPGALRYSVVYTGMNYGWVA